MFCKHCGQKIEDDSLFCGHCGSPVTQTPPAANFTPPPVSDFTPPPAPPVYTPAPAKKAKNKGGLIALIAVLAAVVLGAGGWLLYTFLGDKQPSDKDDPITIQDQQDEGEIGDPDQPTSGESPVEAFPRPSLLDFFGEGPSQPVTGSVAGYTVSSGLPEVVNLDQFYLSDDEIELLEGNLFAVGDGYSSEFFETYEMNRYLQLPNFVTVDSMMHTYHLYFSLLLSRTEENYLTDQLTALSVEMLAYSQEQYDALVGTDWESAAARNLAYFAVPAVLLDDSTQIPENVYEMVSLELEAIYEASGINESPVAEDFVDYSQFKPRGYYAGNQTLEKYFRAMMWYGQLNFKQSEEDLNRSALLINLAMAKSGLTSWETIYTVTSFFAGISDDLSYYEYAPAIEAAYGKLPSTNDLVSNTDAFDEFCSLIEQMPPPAINSVPTTEAEIAASGETAMVLNKGFRFMGQRFTLDAAVMQRLVYSSVKENSAGEKRMLPDTLDMMAAMGSDVALELLDAQGDTDYAGYSEKMDELRTVLKDAAPSTWTTSLYSSWLYTLNPLLEEKGEGYPSFMQSVAWSTKNLETYAGSFTELKHDTVLYSKQMMAEMGGGPIEEVDDRGYVEPETEVWRRFMLLAQQTATGLNQYGLIDSADRENLNRLGALAQQLLTISEKELRNEVLTDDEYELIRSYGGTLEHFWREAVKDKAQNADYFDSQEIPASLVTDIATDPNGVVLQIANGKPSEILVIVPVDGTLRLAKGSVYNFYQFEQPISDRLTDTSWRQMIGEWAMDNGKYNWDAQVEKPWWTTSYRSDR